MHSPRRGKAKAAPEEIEFAVILKNRLLSLAINKHRKQMFYLSAALAAFILFARRIDSPADPSCRN